LVVDGKILHGDISENNIITDPKEADGFKVHTNLDLVKGIGSERSGARRRTGTTEFMAINMLLKFDAR
jgi:hypothetical protein